MNYTWFVKRRPTGVSAFRDEFPYLESLGPIGSGWVQERSVAWAFTSLKSARRALRKARAVGDKAIVVVRVKP